MNNTLAADLNMLERAQFLQRIAAPGQSDGDALDRTYVFKHALTQEAAYHSLLHKTRREIHERVAKTYESLYPNRLDEYAALLARHYELAGDAQRAVEYLTRAGERARRVSAFAEADGAFERAYRLLPGGDKIRQARLLVRRAEVHLSWSNYSDAQRILQEALVLAKDSGDASTAAMSLCGLVRVAYQQGMHSDAQRLGEEALNWARLANDRAALALALRRVGIANNYQGRNALAAQYLQESLALYRELGDDEGIAGCLNSLGIITLEQNELLEARSYFEEALAISRAHNDRYAVSIRLLNLGVIADKLGKIDEAKSLQEQALSLAQQIGDREGAALVTLNLGSLALKKGDFATALIRFRTALAATMKLRSFALALYIIAALGEAQVALGHFEYGAQLLGLAFEHPASTADIRLDFAKTAEALRRVMPNAELEAALDRGKHLDLAVVADAILSNDNN